MKAIEKTIIYTMVQSDNLEPEIERESKDGWIMQGCDYVKERHSPEIQATVKYRKMSRID